MRAATHYLTDTGVIMFIISLLLACKAFTPQVRPIQDDTSVETDEETGDSTPTTETDSPPNDSPVADCDEADCGEHASCSDETNQCECDLDYSGDPYEGCEPVDAVSGWIGSPCDNDNDCDYDGGDCLTDGFPEGMCTQDCTSTCPDLDGTPVTYCIDPVEPEGGHCFSKCDFGLYASSNGCRSGYACVEWDRYNQNGSDYVCVPDGWAEEDPCLHPTNFGGNDDCYLDMVSYGDPELAALTLKILQGTADEDEAEEFLDLNYEYSQDFMTDDLGIDTIYGNYTSGHSASSPMRGMIVHYTASQREDGTIAYFVGDEPHASTHFIVGSYRNGLIVQLFSHRNRAWHAGNTYNIDRFGFDFANAGYLLPAGSGYEDYAGRDYTLALPLHGNEPIHVEGGIPSAPENKYDAYEEWQPFTYYQVLSWIAVSRALDLVYALDEDAIERHGDVSDSRVDPGPALPLTYMKEQVWSGDDVFQVDWLNAYKADPDWIADHPEAR